MAVLYAVIFCSRNTYRHTEREAIYTTKYILNIAGRPHVTYPHVSVRVEV